MIFWLRTRVLRTYWWLKFRRVREQARHEKLTPELVRWAHATTGHLNTPQSWIALEITKREQAGE